MPGPRIVLSKNGNGNVVAARAEGNRNGNNSNQIRCYNCRGFSHYARNCTIRPRRRDATHIQTQLLIAQKEEARIQLQAEEFDLMAAAGDIDKIEEMDQLSVEPNGGIVEQHHATVEETHAYFKLQNFEIQFFKEASKFVRDFKSLAKEADESLDKIKVLEYKNERLLRAVVSQDLWIFTRGLGSYWERKEQIDDYGLHHKSLEEMMLTERGRRVAGFKLAASGFLWCGVNGLFNNGIMT
ncbi:retrovirus-related pol polyprotein from transposon TNT 1-94 [Tanacetum coccineum]